MSINTIDTINSIYDFIFEIDNTEDILEKFRTHSRMITSDEEIDSYVFSLNEKQIEFIVNNYGRRKARKLYYQTNDKVEKKENTSFKYSRSNFELELTKAIIKNNKDLYV